MGDYLIVGKSKMGNLNIATSVFEQIALDTLSALSERELSDQLLLSYKTKKSKAEAIINKNGKLSLKLTLLFASDCDVEQGSKLIQERIYNAISELTEVNNITIDILVSSIITLKK